MKSKKQHSTDSAAEDRPLPPSDAAALAVSTDLLWQATRAEAPDTFVGWAMSAIAAAVGADYAALATAADGRWATVAQWRASCPQGCRTLADCRLPAVLLADVLDSEIARADAGWVAAPLAPRTIEGEVLVVHLPAAPPSPPAPLPQAGEGRQEAALSAVEQIAPGFAAGPHRRAPPRGPRATAPPLGGRCWKSPASGTRPARSNRSWCKWPRRPRGCWGRIGRASSSGTGRTTRWSAGPRWASPKANCASPTTAAWWAR